jgi:hypothetical protein
LQRFFNALLYLYLSGGFAYAWLSPKRAGADPWIDSAAPLFFTELAVTLLIGPLLRAATHGRPPGVFRILTPGALALQAAAYLILYFIWREESAAVLVGISYAVSVAARTVDLAKGDENALLDHLARMLIWFGSIALAALIAMVLLPAQRGPGFAGNWDAWALVADSLYFFFLAVGEVLLPLFRRNVDPRILPQDHVR